MAMESIRNFSKDFSDFSVRNFSSRAKLTRSHHIQLGISRTGRPSRRWLRLNCLNMMSALLLARFPARFVVPGSSRGVPGAKIAWVLVGVPELLGNFDKCVQVHAGCHSVFFLQKKRLNSKILLHFEKIKNLIKNFKKLNKKHVQIPNSFNFERNPLFHNFTYFRLVDNSAGLYFGRLIYHLYAIFDWHTECSG